MKRHIHNRLPSHGVPVEISILSKRKNATYSSALIYVGENEEMFSLVNRNDFWPPLTIVHQHRPNKRVYEACIQNIESVFVTGDFNLPELNWTLATDDILLDCMLPTNVTSEKSKYFTEAVAHLGLLQYNTIRNPLNRTLDLLFIDSHYELDLRRCTSLLTEDTYYPCFDFNICFDDNIEDASEVSFRYNFRKTDFIALNSYFSNYDWSSVFNCTNVDDAAF